MSAVTAEEVRQVTERILSLQAGTIVPAGVDVLGSDGSEESEVLVTVRLAGDDHSTWDPQSFLSVRRAARTAALDVLGSERLVRMVYASADGDDDTDEVPDRGDKQAQSIP